MKKPFGLFYLKSHPFLTRITLMLFGLVVGFLIAEGLLRFVFPYRFIYRFPEIIFDGYKPVENSVADDLLGKAWQPTRGSELFTLRPGMHAHLLSSEFNTRLDTDELACRASKGESDGRPVILGVGDSFMQGYGVEADETFLTLVTDIIHLSLPKAHSINAGVMGYRAANSLERLRELLPMVHPDVVIFEVWVGNDFCSGSGPNSLPMKKNESKLSVLKRLTLHSHLLRFMIDRLRGWNKARRFMLDHGIVGRMTFDEWLVADFDSRCSKGLDSLTETIRTASDITTASGARFVFMVAPLREQIDLVMFKRSAQYNLSSTDPTGLDLDAPNQSLCHRISAVGVPCLDLTKQLREHAAVGAYFTGYDVHWTPAGHKVVAEAVAPIVYSLLPRF